MVRLRKWLVLLLAAVTVFVSGNIFTPQSVSASSDVLFESDFSDSTGWTVDEHLLLDNGKLHADGPEAFSVYRESAKTTQSFNGTYTFNVDVLSGELGSHYNATRITWAYRDSDHYYELMIGNGSTANGSPNVTLKQIDGNSETPLAEDVVYALGGQGVTTLQVIMEEDGFITVNALQGYDLTRLYDRVAAADYNAGEIAIGIQGSPIEYDNFRVVSGIEQLVAPEKPVFDTPTMEEGNFLVQDGEILDPEGNKFIAKGVNVNGPRWPWSRPTIPDVGLIADVWQFNTVRVTMFPKMEAWNISNNMDLDGIVNEFTSRHIVTMLENHDFTGSYPTEDGVTTTENGATVHYMSIDELADYWVELANQYKDNPYVWFNIMNEPGQAGQGYSTAESIERWTAIHERIIGAIRDTGAENIIVLDGHLYGQEGGYKNGTSDSAILSTGEELAGDYDNLVFSLHMYGEWANGQTRLENYLDEAADKKLAVIIGEYGANSVTSGVLTPNQMKTAVAAMFNSAVPREVGRIAWAWEGEDEFDLTAGTGKGGGWEIDKTDGSRPANLSWFGSQVWDDNHETLTLPVALDLPVMANGNFEADFANWAQWSDNLSIAAGAGVDGSKAFKAAAGKQGGGGQDVVVKPNTTYKLTIWGKVSGAPEDGTADAGFQYRPLESDPDSAQLKTILSFDSTSWTKKEAIVTTGPSVAGANVFIWKSSVGIDLLIDDISLIELPPAMANGDFEQGGEQWMDWGGISFVPGEGMGGSQALKVASGGKGGGGQFVTVQPNTTYKLTVWGKVDGQVGADGAAAGFQYKPSDTSDDQVKHILSFDSTEWEKKEVTFTTGAVVWDANIFIWKDADDAVLWIDNVALAVTTDEGGEDDGGDTPAAGITIGSAVFTDAAGNVIAAMPGQGMLLANVTATNNGEAASAVLVVALYDPNGDIAAFSSVGRTLNEGETISFTGGFNLPANTAGYTAKAMVWNNLHDMTPLGDPAHLGN